MIQGCESTGVISTVKHFVCNDQEHERRAVDTIVTPRALREIYLRPFQIVARDASPGALMTSYNKVNGIHVAEDPKLLEDLIRKEWGWDPLMISDWYAILTSVLDCFGTNKSQVWYLFRSGRHQRRIRPRNAWQDTIPRTSCRICNVVSPH